MIKNEKIIKYRLLAAGNHHGELLEEVAKDYGASYFVNIFKSINTIHNLEESLKPDMYALRNRFKAEFREFLKERLEKKEFERIAMFV